MDLAQLAVSCSFQSSKLTCSFTLCRHVKDDGAGETKFKYNMTNFYDIWPLNTPRKVHIICEQYQGAKLRLFPTDLSVLGTLGLFFGSWHFHLSYSSKTERGKNTIQYSEHALL